jgi:cytochrome c oxidase subunit 2
MVKPGTIALPVILALGAITGYLTYTYFGAVTPQEGTVVSPYREELSAASGSNDNNNSTGGGKQIDESQFSEVVNIKILDGSSVQGSPDYDPDAATASSDALITWVNEDTTLHTATSGTGPDDAESGQLFDSGFLNQGQKYSVPAADFGTGEHTYHCQVHPYMVSTITVE